ncbi:MAG TPA: hypothetical protein IGR64_08490 [Leptolyngbyaceae cyanobacterium M65_K2018_010]|nr:hypothetical protein [Leptolyngbyaceae cyanobacterium M65_K2018_010]
MQVRRTTDSPLFGLLTNGDEVLFLKLTARPNRCYGLSRTFSLYTVASEAQQVIQILKSIGNTL